MTEGRRKKLQRLEVRLGDIIGELVGLAAYEDDTGGKQGTVTAKLLYDAADNLKISENLIKQAERGKEQ